MLLAETHCHTAEVSLCGCVAAAEIPALYQSAGYGLIVCTDHYNHWTLAELASDRKEQINRWLSGYRLMRKAGEAAGVAVLLGMELALPGFSGEFLIYGLAEEHLVKYPELCVWTLEKVCQMACEEGLLVYQAHPFRDNMERAPVELLHGVEVFNGNRRHVSRNELAEEHAARHGLRRIAGSDFHQLDDLGRGGIWLPDGIADNKGLVAVLSESNPALHTAPPAL